VISVDLSVREVGEGHNDIAGFILEEGDIAKYMEYAERFFSERDRCSCDAPIFPHQICIVTQRYLIYPCPAHDAFVWYSLSDWVASPFDGDAPDENEEDAK